MSTITSTLPVLVVENRSGIKLQLSAVVSNDDWSKLSFVFSSSNSVVKEEILISHLASNRETLIEGLRSSTEFHLHYSRLQFTRDTKGEEATVLITITISAFQEVVVELNRSEQLLLAQIIDNYFESPMTVSLRFHARLCVEDAQREAASFENNWRSQKDANLAAAAYLSGKYFRAIDYARAVFRHS